MDILNCCKHFVENEGFRYHGVNLAREFFDE